MPSINKQCCPTCHQSINERRITLFYDLVPALYAVMKWCQYHNTYSFGRTDIKHLFKNENQSARFGDLPKICPQLIRSPKRGEYQINTINCVSFFKGNICIPTVIYHDPLTGQYRTDPDSYRYISQIQKLSEFLTSDRQYIAEYAPTNEAQRRAA